MSEPAAADAPRGRVSGLAVWSWALYDFSNTLFSVSIISTFFPLWFGSEMGAGFAAVNYATAASAFLVVVTAPFMGAIGDLRQRRKPYLILTTLLAVAFAAALDFSGSVAVAAVLFVMANFTYQSALIFYNALLPGVSVGRGAGRVSGYGTAFGYVGAIFGLVFLSLFVTHAGEVRSLLGPLGGWVNVGGERNSNAFLPTAALYLLISLPVFFLVPDRAVRAPRPLRIGAIYRDVYTTVKNIRAYTGAGTFIVATMLYTDAANTAVSNMAAYGRQVFAMDETRIRNLLLFSTVFAAAGSFGFGFLSDRIGPKRTLFLVLALWIFAIAFAIVAPYAWMLFIVGPIVGIALGGTWSVSRVMLVALSPPEKMGEFFGLYGLAGKLSAVFGPMLTGLLLDIFSGLGHNSYRVAISSLVLFMLIGILLLARIPDARPDPKVKEYAPGADVPEAPATSLDSSA